MTAKYINFTPPNCKDGFGLYHWSPTTRRKQIIHYGIRVGMWSPDRLWKPPCSCWADNAELAWILSGQIHPEIKEWDLWMTYSNVPKGIELRIDYSPGKQGHYVKEYRIYERIYKRDLWYVGSRNG